MKHMRRFTALVLTLVMVFSLTATASAAATETVTVKLSPNITVTLDGEAQAMADVNGNPVYPVLYGGTTYLPVRAVGNMLGLGVDWDQATQTVLLTTSDGKTKPTTPSGKAPTDAKPTDITVSINPNITVKLDGEVQKMTNVNGDPVYPMLYGGTTYLPVRAVSNMLDVDVDWDGATQTVILENKAFVFTIKLKDGTVLKYGPDDREVCRKDLEALGYPENFITARLTRFDGELGAWNDKNAAKPNQPSIPDNPDIFTTDQLDQQNQVTKMETSDDAKTLGKNHIGYDWCEIDWSTADQGYIRVKVNEQCTSYTRCQILWYQEEVAQGEYHNKSESYVLPEGKWATIPLSGGDKEEYAVTIEQGWLGDELEKMQAAMDSAKTEADWAAIDAVFRNTLTARFTGNAIDEKTRWTLSYLQFDYENSSNTIAKAKELTANCKTDAEKISAIYNYVANTISYDNQELKRRQAASIERKKAQEAGTYVNEYGGAKFPLSTGLEPDSILDSKKGVCQHYAVLMAAMLRSLGIPCKVVSGDMYTGEIVKGWSDDGWAPHAWVAVKPETGTLSISGAGKDFALTAVGEADNSNPTGWIRLDPTNARVPSITSNDSKYRADEWY